MTLILTSRQVEDLFHPWPVSNLGHNLWRLRVAKPSELAKYKCFWWVTDGKRKRRVSMKRALKMVLDGDWGHQRHMIHSMARSGYVPRAVIIDKGVVIDGNHGLLALLVRDYYGPILVVEGPVTRRRKKP